MVVVALPVCSLILYGLVLLGSLASHARICVSSRVQISLPLTLLAAMAACRLWWSASTLVTPTQHTLIMTSAADMLSNWLFYAWMSSILAAAVPRTGISDRSSTDAIDNQFSTAGADLPLGIWRTGLRLSRLLRISVVVWVLLVVGLSVPELVCLGFAEEKMAEQALTVNATYAATVLHQCGDVVSRIESAGLGFVSLFAAAAIGILHARVLQLHETLSAPQGTPTEG